MSLYAIKTGKFFWETHLKKVAYATITEGVIFVCTKCAKILVCIVHLAHLAHTAYYMLWES
jgi:hypothetical protein